MILFAPITHATSLPGVGLQVTAHLAAPGPSLRPSYRLDAAALHGAAERFTKAAAPELSEMFAPAPVGAVDDIAVAADGSMAITATVTAPTAMRKVSFTVLRALAVAIRVLDRDPAAPDRITKAEVIGVALVDAQDDGFDRLAKGAASGPSGHHATMATIAATGQRVLDLSAQVLDLDARLRPYARRGDR